MFIVALFIIASNGNLRMKKVCDLSTQLNVIQQQKRMKY